MWPWILLAVIAALAVAAGTYYLGWQRIWPPQKATQSSASPSPEADLIRTDLDLTYVQSDGVIKSKPATFDINTPSEWRAHGPASNSCGDDITYAKLYDCAKYSFADSIGSPKSLNGDVNSITVYDLNDWLTTTDKTTDSLVPYFAGLQTAKDKQAAWSNLRGLSASSSFSVAAIKNGDKTIFNPFLTNAAFVGSSVPQFVESNDSSLKGYAFISSLCQNECYQPEAFVVLSGEANGIPVLITGQFTINDQERLAYSKLTDAQQSTFANNYFNGNYTYPADTKALFADVLSTIRTASLKAK
jgi:hypothetical protein